MGWNTRMTPLSVCWQGETVRRSSPKTLIFPDISLVRGFPPPVIWLKCGNTSTERVAKLLLESEDEIKAFLGSGEAACLEIY